MRRQRAIAIMLNGIINLYYQKLAIKARCDKSNDSAEVLFGELNLEEFDVACFQMKHVANWWLPDSVKKHRQAAIEAAQEYIRMINELRKVKVLTD